MEPNQIRLTIRAVLISAAFYILGWYFLYPPASTVTIIIYALVFAGCASVVIAVLTDLVTALIRGERRCANHSIRPSWFLRWGFTIAVIIAASPFIFTIAGNEPAMNFIHYGIGGLTLVFFSYIYI